MEQVILGVEVLLGSLTNEREHHVILELLREQGVLSMQVNLHQKDQKGGGSDAIQRS
jgi:hypothetical protein